MKWPMYVMYIWEAPPRYRLLLRTNTCTIAKSVSLVPLRLFSYSGLFIANCLRCSRSTLLSRYYPVLCRSALSTTGSVVRGRPLQLGISVDGWKYWSIAICAGTFLGILNTCPNNLHRASIIFILRGSHWQRL